MPLLLDGGVAPHGAFVGEVSGGQLLNFVNMFRFCYGNREHLWRSFCSSSLKQPLAFVYQPLSSKLEDT